MDSPQNPNRLSPNAAVAGGPSRRRYKALAVILVIVAVLGGGLWLLNNRPTDENPVKISLDQAEALASISAGEGAELVLEGDSAQERNAQIPLSGGALEKIAGFSVAGGDKATYSSALKCLSQAVYYEAANEPAQGKRAVAQVVLNRMRHPAYPSSVCGVVYDGATKPVCQFSFTCDGSLLRTPMARQWQQSVEVAKAALSGTVEPSVGSATHYHADYVLPRWAYSLGKIDKIGAHIFYRFKGNWGRANAFSSHWSGRESIPSLDMARLRNALNADLEVSEVLAVSDEFVPGLTVAPHVSDRHAAADVGGRIDTTKEWRLSIPDPVAASSTYRDTLDQQGDRAPIAEAALADASQTRKITP